MITEHPGLARQTWRWLRSASGVTELAELEARVDALDEAVGENTGLAGPLADLVARLEAQLVPALERRQRRIGEGAGEGEAPGPDVPETAGPTVNYGIAADPTDE